MPDEQPHPLRNYPPPRRYFMRRHRQSFGEHRQPQGPDPNARREHLGVVVQPNEKLVLQAAAQAEGLTLSSWARKTLLAAVGM